MAVVKEKILDLNLSSEELFDLVVFEKMISRSDKGITKFRLIVPDEKPLVVTMTMVSEPSSFPSSSENSFQVVYRLTGHIISDNKIRASHIANATFSQNGEVKIDSFLGRGATIGNLFSDFRTFIGGKNLHPIDIGEFLHRYVHSPDRTALEEIYRAGDPEKLELWAERAYQIPLRPSRILPAKNVVDFTRKYGRPPFINQTNDFEIKYEKPFTVELFNRNVALFEKNPMKNGGSFTLTNASSGGENLFLNFVYPDGKEAKNVAIFGHEYNLLGESLLQIAKDFPAEEFLHRVSLAAEKSFSHDFLFATERMISRDRPQDARDPLKRFEDSSASRERPEGSISQREHNKRLKETDLKILAEILSGATECRLEKKSLVSTKDNSSHDLLVAYISKLFLNSNGRFTQKRGNFVLADNGELLKGRFVLGGDDSLRENLVKRQLKLVEIDRSLER